MAHSIGELHDALKAIGSQDAEPLFIEDDYGHCFGIASVSRTHDDGTVTNKLELVRI